MACQTVPHAAYFSVKTSDQIITLVYITENQRKHIFSAVKWRNTASEFSFESFVYTLSIFVSAAL